MATSHDITTDQLRQMIHLKERIEFLQALLRRVRGDGSTRPKENVGRPAGKRVQPVVAIGKAQVDRKQRRRKLASRWTTNEN